MSGEAFGALCCIDENIRDEPRLVEYVNANAGRSSRWWMTVPRRGKKARDNFPNSGMHPVVSGSLELEIQKARPKNT